MPNTSNNLQHAGTNLGTTYKLVEVSLKKRELLSSGSVVTDADTHVWESQPVVDIVIGTSEIVKHHQVLTVAAAIALRDQLNTQLAKLGK